MRGGKKKRAFRQESRCRVRVMASSVMEKQTKKKKCVGGALSNGKKKRHLEESHAREGSNNEESGKDDGPWSADDRERKGIHHPSGCATALVPSPNYPTPPFPPASLQSSSRSVVVYKGERSKRYHTVGEKKN